VRFGKDKQSLLRQPKVGFYLRLFLSLKIGFVVDGGRKVGVESEEVGLDFGEVEV
jgi:hypothetical protein